MDEVEIVFANFQILGPLGCQGWVVIPQNVKKIQNHCTLMHSMFWQENSTKLERNTQGRRKV